MKDFSDWFERGVVKGILSEASKLLAEFKKIKRYLESRLQK